MKKKSNLAYQIGCTIWASLQFLGYLMFFIMLSPTATEGDSRIFVIVVGAIVIFVGTIIDMKIRDISHGTVVGRFLSTLLVGFLRLPAQIFTLVQMGRKGKDEEIFEKGNYKPYILNKWFYILFNHDHEQTLVSAKAKQRIKDNEAAAAKRKADYEAREAARKAELAKFKAEADHCNVKFVAYGDYDNEGRYWDIKFCNNDFISTNSWNKDTGIGYGGIETRKNHWGTTINAFYIKEIKVNGVRINKVPFSNHLNFNLKPGTYKIDVSFYFARNHSGWHGGDVSTSDYWPSDTPKDKGGVMEKTVTLNVNIQAGYRYHLALFCKNYASYIRYTDKRSGVFLYDIRNDIHFNTYFDVMGEADVKKIANTGWVDTGLVLDQVN